MNESTLDNPIWYSLQSVHRDFSIQNQFAARYPADVLIGACVSEETLAAFNELRKLFEVGETTYLAGTIPDGVEGWEVTSSAPIHQMICVEFTRRPGVDAHRLTIEDVPEMLDLVAIAQPGPFLTRTIELGHYYGVRLDGRLVAMAGERMHLTGFCEISAVCTHPEYRGLGYGGAMTSMVAEGILSRGEIPFLHVAAGNDVAFQLYQKLGFRLRTEIMLHALQRLS